MTNKNSRRDFLKTSALLAGAAAVGLETPRVHAADAAKASGPKVFRAGAAAVDISPTLLDYRTAGNHNVTKKTTGVRDPLYARSLVLHDGREQIAFLVVDVVSVAYSIVEKIKDLVVRQTGIPKDRIMLSATHTHSAPRLTPTAQAGEETFTCENIARAVVEAQKNLAPAKIGWAVGNEPKNVFCRRFLMKEGTAINNPAFGTRHDRAQMNPGASPNKVSPTGPVDSLLPVISVVAPDGKPIAVFVNWSCHHAGQGLASSDISSDRFGVFCKEMERRIAEKVGKDKTSDKFVAIMANGTSGDANCRNVLDPKRKYTYETVGRDTAEAAMAVWPNIEYHDWVPLGMTERRIMLNCYKPTPEEVKAAKEYMADEKTPKGSLVAKFIQSVATTKKWKDSMEVPLQAIRIGELGMTTLPGEFFGITGIELKAKSPFQPTMNIGLANAAFSYVPPPEQFELGGYAVWRSASRCLAMDAEPTIKETLLDMLRLLREET